MLARIRFPSRLEGLVLTTGLALFLSTPGSGQTYTAGVAMGDPPQDPHERSGSRPVQRYRDRHDGVGNDDGWGWMETTRNRMNFFARSDHYQQFFATRTASGGSSTWDDVVFTSSEDTVTVRLNLNLAGQWQGNFAVVVRVSGQGWSGEWSNLGSGSGVLTGYDGGSPFFFQSDWMTFPTNVPVTVALDFGGESTASQPGTWAEISQGLSLGAAGFQGSGPVFELPDGVTVNSVQAGIVDNELIPDTDVYLGSDPEVATRGEPLDLSGWNGVSGAPGLLFVTALDGTPLFLNTGIREFFDDDDRWLVRLIVPDDPQLEGLEVTLRLFTLDAMGRTTQSNDHSILFQ